MERSALAVSMGQRSAIERHGHAIIVRLTGTYGWQAFVIDPSASVYALWEHENAYTDSLGTLQADRNFDAGRARRRS